MNNAADFASCTAQTISGFLGLLVLGLSYTCVSAAGTQSAKPNIIVIYTDDQGYGDVSTLNPNAKFQTPHLDRLAQEGIALTNAHSPDSVCTPSRYGLLTGRYAWRTMLKRGVLGSEGTCLIPDDQLTIASMLRDDGYETALVGKWHLGMDFPGTRASRDWSQPIEDMPLDKGFDYFYGIPASLNYGILAWFENRHVAQPPTLFTAKKRNKRSLDYRIMPPYDSSPEETRKRLKKEGFEVAPDFVDNQCLTRFTNKAIQWIGAKAESVRQGRPFFLYLAYTSPHYPICPLPEFHGRGHCGPYGEFLIETDYHIGRIQTCLESNDLDDNTLIIFTSDNGPEKRWKKSLFKYQHDSRGGFREGKRSVYEGGHRVPMLMRWPAGIVAPSRQCNHLIGQTDLLATIAEVVGISLPDNAGEDSHSFASVLFDADSTHTRLPLITHGNGGREFRYAITEGSWKLILPDKAHSTELYDLAVDPAEENNIAERHPGIVDRLTTQINRIIAQGRTTDGPAQPNDTGYWEDLTWMTREQYRQFVAEALLP